MIGDEHDGCIRPLCRANPGVARCDEGADGALDLHAIAEKWLQMCGPCDGGLPMGCSHPDEDYRPVMLALVEAVARVEALTWDPPTRDAISGRVTPSRRKVHVRVRDLDAALRPVGGPQ